MSLRSDLSALRKSAAGGSKVGIEPEVVRVAEQSFTQDGGPR